MGMTHKAAHMLLRPSEGAPELREFLSYSACCLILQRRQCVSGTRKQCSHCQDAVCCKTIVVTLYVLIQHLLQQAHVAHSLLGGLGYSLLKRTAALRDKNNADR